MQELQDAATIGGSSSAQDAERRWAHRKTSGYHAVICRQGAGTNISCSIVNMSTTGACLKLKNLPPSVKSSPHLPAYFTLAIRVDRMEIDCAIVWRKGDRLGVKFLSAPRSMERAKE